MNNDRRARFIAWFTAEYGGDTAESRKKFMDATGYTKGRLVQLFDPTQPFGERAAREIALRLGQAEDLFLRDGRAHARDPSTPYDERQPRASLTVGSIIGSLATALDSLSDADRERAAAALVTLAKAPDSQRARHAVEDVFSGLPLPESEVAGAGFSEYALDLARQIDAIPTAARRHRAYAAAISALHLQEARADAATAGQAPPPSPRPGAHSRKLR